MTRINLQGLGQRQNNMAYYENNEIFGYMLGIQSTSGNATFEIADVFYADHAGNMHDMMQESMLEGAECSEVPMDSENSQNDKESETPGRSLKEKGNS
ncbi:hypothetical protein TNCV_1004231 [Trichonephila clavipes]|nr:hypothetical protein TNCV_1004231 [Trichonephila clavipes]